MSGGGDQGGDAGTPPADGDARADRDIAKINALAQDALGKAAEIEGLLRRLARLLEEPDDAKS